MSVCAQACLTLCDPVDCSLLGFSVHGIFQARILEWITISYSRVYSWPDWNLYLLHWQVDSLPLAPPQKPNIYQYWSTEYRHRDRRQTDTWVDLFLPTCPSIYLSIYLPAFTVVSNNPNISIVLNIYFLFMYTVQFSHSVMSNSLWPHGL